VKKFLEFIVLVIIIIALGALFFYLADTVFSPGPSEDFSRFNRGFLDNYKQNIVCFNPPNGKCFFVKLAKTDMEKEQGLMFQDQLDGDKGMLFIFEKEDVYPFWMKNTVIPLDIIWIDKNQKVVFIKENSQPCQTVEGGKKNKCLPINPKIKALYVLEINAGFSKESGIKTGDSVKFK